VAILRDVLRRVKEVHPFFMIAYAFMPDHLHLLLRLGESTHVIRLMQSLQRHFTLAYKDTHGIKEPLRLWQHGFYDHRIRDDDDLIKHLNYIHYNPVKHGLTRDALQWPHTSLPDYVQRGWSDAFWDEDELARWDQEGFAPGE
jgi:putative transposase